MKCSLGIFDFLEEISSLSHSIVFLYFFALITEEGFLISPCYSLELCVRMSFSPLPLASLLFSASCEASSASHFAFLHFMCCQKRKVWNWGSLSGEGNGSPLQYSCLEHSTDRGTWQATVHGISKSQTWLSDSHTHKHMFLNQVVTGQLSPVALKSPLQAWAMAAMLKLQPSLSCETISSIPADMRRLWSSNPLCLPASFPGFEPLTSTLWVSQIIVKCSYSHPQTVCV